MIKSYWCVSQSTQWCVHKWIYVGKFHDLWDKTTIYGVGLHKFSHVCKHFLRIVCKHFLGIVCKHCHQEGSRRLFFGDRNCVLLVDFLELGETINSGRNWEILKKLKRAKTKIEENWKPIFFFFHSWKPFKLDALGWFRMEAVWSSIVHSPNLILSDFHLLLHMKTFLATQGLDDEEELHTGVLHGWS